MKLDGKVALITGAGGGIGAAIAERFVADGARICITGRHQEKLDNVAACLPEESVLTCAGRCGADGEDRAPIQRQT